MDSELELLEVETKMDGTVQHLLHDFASVRTGKSSPALLENLDVYVRIYDSVMKLKAVAVVSTPEPRLLMVQPFDPSTTQDIERAIRDSKLGLNPSAADRSIRVPIPDLSEERRREMAKLVKQMGEEAKVSARQVRKEGMDSAKKMKAGNFLTEDGQKDFETNVQKLTDKAVKDIDVHVMAKEKEIMKI
jgi:ribosome recycling factor